MATSAKKREPVRLPSFVYLSLFTGRRLWSELVLGTCLLIISIFVLVKDHAGDALRPVIAPARTGTAGTAIRLAKISCTEMKVIPFIGDIIPRPCIFTIERDPFPYHTPLEAVFCLTICFNP